MSHQVVFTILTLMSLLLFSCAKEEQTRLINLSVALERDQLLAQDHSLHALSIPTPTTTGEVNCVAVFVRYEDGDNPNFCLVENAGGTTLGRFDFATGGGLATFQAGAPTSVEVRDVEFGRSLAISVIGFNSTVCPNLNNDLNNSEFEPGSAQTSEPVFILRDFSIGRPGSDRITINASGVIEPMGDCQGPFFDFAGGDGPPVSEALAYHIDATRTESLVDSNNDGILEGLQNISSFSYGTTVNGSINQSTWPVASNNNNSLVFNGTDAAFYTDYPTTDAYSVFMVFYPLALVNGECLWSANETSFNASVCVTAGTLVYDWGGETIATAALSSSAPYVLGAIGDRAGSNRTLLRINGVETNDPMLTQNNAACNFTFGAQGSWGTTCASPTPTLAGYFDGHIGEVLIYNRVLTSTEITAVEDYLKSKWTVSF